MGAHVPPRGQGVVGVADGEAGVTSSSINLSVSEDGVISATS